MKKIFYTFLFLILLVLNSCSKEGSNSPNTNTHTTNTTPTNSHTQISRYIKTDFIDLALAQNGETSLKDGVYDPKTRIKWRGRDGYMVLNNKGRDKRLMLRLTTNQGGYLAGLFESQTKPMDLSGADARLLFDNRGYEKFDYFVILYDGESWFVSDTAFDYSMAITDVKQWRHIVQSPGITNAIQQNSNLPYHLTFDSNIDVNLSRIQGFGIYYNPTEKASFTAHSLALYELLPDISVYPGHFTAEKVSKYLFGVDMRPNYSPQKMDEMLDYLSHFCTIIRWPGGSGMERWNIQKFSGYWQVNYFVDKVKAKMPDTELLIGVPSSIGMYDDAHSITPYTIMDHDSDTPLKNNYGSSLNDPDYAQTYATGLVNYLNVDYTSNWGSNTPMQQPADIHYLEIGNEFDLEVNRAKKRDAISSDVNNSDLYGGSLHRYAAALHQKFPALKLVGPITTAGAINDLVQIVKDYGDDLDVIGMHNYTDYPDDYIENIKTMQYTRKHYMHDTARRRKSEVTLAFTEYNSLNTEGRNGEYNATVWEKAIWHAWTFGNFIKNGLDIATLWHVDMPGGHAMFKLKDGHWEPLPLYYSLKFFHDNINLNAHPKVLAYANPHKDLKIIPIEEDNKIVIFVVNTANQNIPINLYFRNAALRQQAVVHTLTKGSNGSWDIGITGSSDKALNSDGSLSLDIRQQSINAIQLTKE